MHVEYRDPDENRDGDRLDARRKGIDRSRLLDADNQKEHQEEYDDDRRQIDDAPGKRAFRKFLGKPDADRSQKIVEVAGPTVGDGRDRHAVFQNEVPGDDPRDQLAEGRIAIAISTA